MTIGEDVEIAYCPSGSTPAMLPTSVRIGCSNPEVGEALVQLYSQLTSEDVRYVGKLEVAEAAKVIENVQRDINIALVNELARIFPAMDVDVEDVLSAAATKWNFHRVGVGVGGIPVDPYYMIQRASDVGVAGLITAARFNRSMPNHVAQVLVDILWKAGLSPSPPRCCSSDGRTKPKWAILVKRLQNRWRKRSSSAASTSACSTRTSTMRPSPNR